MFCRMIAHVLRPFIVMVVVEELRHGGSIPRALDARMRLEGRVFDMQRTSLGDPPVTSMRVCTTTTGFSGCSGEGWTRQSTSALTHAMPWS